MLDEKYNDLLSYLRQFEKVALAYSSGVDSNFLLYALNEAIGNENILAVTINGDMNLKEELKDSKLYTKMLNIEHEIINVDIEGIENFKKNPKDRCYYCKKMIFQEIISVSEKRGIYLVLDGTNKDDTLDYRPGLKALEELKIISPLKELSFTKEEIRLLSKSKNIKTWDKPSMACLASRIPYDEEITKEKLNIVELSETYLYNLGYKDFRVRVHEKLARIELNKLDIENFIVSKDYEKVEKYFKSIGFVFVSLDLTGYKTGSMNNIL